MEYRALRETVGLKQSELQIELRKDGTDASISDISRLENGALEKYMILSQNYISTVNRLISQEKVKVPLESKFNHLQVMSWQCNAILDYITQHGKIDYPTAHGILPDEDRRGIRQYISEIRRHYPIIELEQGGWALAKTIGQCNKQLNIYEKKKRVYSYQQMPLMRKKYELIREAGND